MYCSSIFSEQGWTFQISYVQDSGLSRNAIPAEPVGASHKNIWCSDHARPWEHNKLPFLGATRLFGHPHGKFQDQSFNRVSGHREVKPFLAKCITSFLFPSSWQRNGLWSLQLCKLPMLEHVYSTWITHVTVFALHVPGTCTGASKSLASARSAHPAHVPH